jgi:hypothetical protein
MRPTTQLLFNDAAYRPPVLLVLFIIVATLVFKTAFDKHRLKFGADRNVAVAAHRQVFRAGLFEAAADTTFGVKGVKLVENVQGAARAVVDMRMMDATAGAIEAELSG